ncbi:cytochrome P450 [Nocardia sp. NPDC003482]
MQGSSELVRIPRAQGGIPVIGHGALLARRPLEFLKSLPNNGPMCRIRLGTADVVFVSEPSLVAQVLSQDIFFDKGGPFFERARPIAGSGLGTCPHAEHRRQRRLCTPAFSDDQIDMYSELMSRAIESLVNSWSDRQVINVGREVSLTTFQIAVRAMFSTSLSDESVRGLTDDICELTHGLFRRTAMPDVVNRLPLPMNRRFDQALRRVRETALAIIAERRQETVRRGDLLQSLMEARYEDAPEAHAMFADVELVDQIMTMFFGGAETSAGSITWSLYMLDRNPGVRRRLEAEVDNVLEGGVARKEDLAHLPYTEKVVTETMRLYPPSWILTRVVSQDTELGGVVLPSGTMIAVSQFTVHHDDSIYPNATEFDPDRWEDGQIPGQRMRQYLSFGLGPRRCIAERFGRREVSLALATIIGKWRCTSVSDRPVAMTLQQIPVSDRVTMRVTKR